MKIIIISTIVGFSLLCFAENPPFDLHSEPKNDSEREARKIYFQEQLMKNTGGLVMRNDSQKGEVVLVNCNNAVDDSLLKDRADYFAKETKFKFRISEGEFQFPSPNKQGSVSLFIIDSKHFPSLLIAPENGWALVNIDSLKTDKKTYFDARIKKEVTRALGHLLGACNSTYPNSLLSGIKSVADLDKNPEFRLQGDVFRRMPAYMVSFGVTPAHFATYKKACLEGWAAQPTNEYQKVIRDKVHQLPTDPIKIKPETKKVTE